MANKFNRIILNYRGQVHEKESPLKSGSTIKPGMLLQFDVMDVKPHASAAGIPQPLIVAVEAPWREGAGIDDVFDVAGEQVPYHYLLPGEEFYGLIDAGEDIAAGDILESAGNGSLQADTSGDKFRALEAVDNSAGYTPARIHVEVL